MSINQTIFNRERMLVGRECEQRNQRRWRRQVDKQIFHRQRTCEPLNLVAILILILNTNEREIKLNSNIYHATNENVNYNFFFLWLHLADLLIRQFLIILLPSALPHKFLHRLRNAHNEVNIKIVWSTLSIKYFLWARMAFVCRWRSRKTSNGEQQSTRINYWFSSAPNVKGSFSISSMKIDLHLTWITFSMHASAGRKEFSHISITHTLFLLSSCR